MSRDGASLIGTVLAGKYRLDCILGAGGFGAVYRGWHLLLDVPIAVKVAFRVDGALGRRFQREARTLMTLRHPNIVRMYDYGQDPQGHVYMVQEFVDGRPLSTVLQSDGPLPPAAVVEIALQVLAALGETHRRGIIHRDIKPANLMLVGPLDTPRVQLLDFGIAKIQGVDEHDPSDLTRPGATLGTPSYMAPEQIRGRASPASDLYALGGTLHHLLTGRKPYPYPQPQVFIAHLQDPIPRLPDDMPQGLAEVVARALCKSLDGRYRSAAEMAEALSAVHDLDVTVPLGPRPPVLIGPLLADTRPSSRPLWAVSPPADGPPAGGAPLKPDGPAQGSGGLDTTRRDRRGRPAGLLMLAALLVGGGWLALAGDWRGSADQVGVAGTVADGADRWARVDSPGGGSRDLSEAMPDAMPADAMSANAMPADAAAVAEPRRTNRAMVPESRQSSPDGRRKAHAIPAGQMLAAASPTETADASLDIPPPGVRRDGDRADGPAPHVSLPVDQPPAEHRRDAEPPDEQPPDEQPPDEQPPAEPRAARIARSPAPRPDPEGIARRTARAVEAALDRCRCADVPERLARLERLGARAATPLRQRYTKQCVVVGMPGGCP